MVRSSSARPSCFERSSLSTRLYMNSLPTSRGMLMKTFSRRRRSTCRPYLPKSSRQVASRLCLISSLSCTPPVCSSDFTQAGIPPTSRNCRARRISSEWRAAGTSSPERKAARKCCCSSSPGVWARDRSDSMSSRCCCTARIPSRSRHCRPETRPPASYPLNQRPSVSGPQPKASTMSSRSIESAARRSACSWGDALGKRPRSPARASTHISSQARSPEHAHGNCFGHCLAHSPVPHCHLVFF